MNTFDGLIVILGSPNSDSGELSSIARERCALALDIHRRHPTYAIAPTGGFGPHFNRTHRPHGAYVREYLIELGVPTGQILKPLESSNTIEDARLTGLLIEELLPPHTIVITSDYHLERARFLFDRMVRACVAWHCSRTDALHCTEDLAALRAHESEALQRLIDQNFTP